jgi:hypothetical protein
MSVLYSESGRTLSKGLNYSKKVKLRNCESLLSSAKTVLIFQKMQQVALDVSAKSSADLAKQDRNDTCVMLFTVLGWCGWVALNSYKIYLWTTYEFATCEAKLALWLGISGIACLALDSVLLPCIKCVNEELAKPVASVSVLFGFCMFIWGTVMLCEIDYANHVCPTDLYGFTWYFFLITWILQAAAIVVGCACIVAK